MYVLLLATFALLYFKYLGLDLIYFLMTACCFSYKNPKDFFTFRETNLIWRTYSDTTLPSLHLPALVDMRRQSFQTLSHDLQSHQYPGAQAYTAHKHSKTDVESVQHTLTHTIPFSIGDWLVCVWIPLAPSSSPRLSPSLSSPEDLSSSEWTSGGPTLRDWFSALDLVHRHDKCSLHSYSTAFLLPKYCKNRY